MSDQLKEDIAINQELPFTWHAFFTRFGRLTEVQRRVIPILLDKKDLLVCAPTASGKTEAVCAPLLEMNVDRREKWRILYVAPTRALVNDLYFRLYYPLSELGYSISRITGDHHDAIENSRIIITTPESFDSMLCRGKVKGGTDHILATVVAVVLDEVHLLYGNSRGEQLRWLIVRLRRLRAHAEGKGWSKSSDLQIVGLSATLPDPLAVCRYYLGLGGKHVVVTGQREIETVSVECCHPCIEESLPAYLDHIDHQEKILVFCNSRKRVDTLSAIMRDTIESYGFGVRAHHGSLSKKVREEAEDFLREQKAVVLFATSTLEIGIDIGDVDLVVLDGPAPEISALLQRIGRGNRRTQKTRVMACAGDMAGVVIQSAMIEAARQGHLGTCNDGFCYGVIIQQVASYIFQSPRRKRSREAVIEFIEQCTPEINSIDILDHLVHLEIFLEDEVGIKLNKEWLDRSGRGEIHSNIESGHGTSVVDVDTGSLIAQGIRYNAGKILNVGGNFLNITKWRDRKLEVRREKERVLPDAVWSYLTRSWIKGDGQPQAVRDYLGFLPAEWPVIFINGVRCIFHFGGARRKTLLKLISKEGLRQDADIIINEWFLEIPAFKYTGKPEWLTSIGKGTLRLTIYDEIDKLERSLGRPTINRKLPLDVRYKEIESWLRLDSELEHYELCEWNVARLPEQIYALEILRSGIKGA